VEDLGPLLWSHRTPGLEALLGRVDGCLCLGGTTAGDLRDPLLVDRRDVGERVDGSDPLAADPVLGGDLDALDLDALAQCRPPRDSFVPERYGGWPGRVKRRFLVPSPPVEQDALMGADRREERDA
jgi:hypothetical protein